MDFVGFTFNGKHSIRDLHIYRTSDGDRYNENITPTMADKTAQPTAGHGQHYFGTQFTNRTFEVSYAFDNLTESDIREIKRTFNGEGIYELIFDERPYCVWSAKVTGTASIKHICFDDGLGNRLYKGEGNISFTCYQTFGHTPNTLKRVGSDKKQAIQNETVQCGLIVSAGEIIKNLSASPIALYYYERDNGLWNNVLQEKYLAVDETSEAQVDWYIEKIGMTVTTIPTLEISGEQYSYYNSDCFESDSTDEFLDGRNINHYPICIYPTKIEWAISSGITSFVRDGYNPGDIPASFIAIWEENIKKDSIICVGGHSIVLKESQDPQNLIWDSKTGIVKTIRETANGKREYLVRTEGEVCIKLPIDLQED